MFQQICFESAELACLHEAGHAMVAHQLGATVVEMELYRDQQRSYGRTRVRRTEDQAPVIALGGFAIEYLLFRAARLRKVDGGIPTDKEFIDAAIDNASEDRISYFGADHRGSDGQWPAELDREFMQNSISIAENELTLGAVEPIAEALMVSGKLGISDLQLLLPAVARP